MESNDPRTSSEPTANDARAALADAEAARQTVVRDLHYPPAYTRLMAFSGASLPLLAVTGSDTVPGPFLKALFVALGVLGVGASGWAFSLFESSNGVRISGFRTGRRLSFTYLAASLVLILAVAIISSATGAWWVALIASPVGGLIAVVYSNAWLADYRRTHA